MTLNIDQPRLKSRIPSTDNRVDKVFMTFLTSLTLKILMIDFSLCFLTSDNNGDEEKLISHHFSLACE